MEAEADAKADSVDINVKGVFVVDERAYVIPPNIEWCRTEDYMASIGDLDAVQHAILYVVKCHYSAKRRPLALNDNWRRNRNMKPRALMTVNPEENAITPTPSSYVGESALVHQ